MSERFDWHPEPELIDVRDRERAREALETLGERTWTEALDWLYERAMVRPTAPDLYPELRAAYYGPSGGPGPTRRHTPRPDQRLCPTIGRGQRR